MVNKTGQRSRDNLNQLVLLGRIVGVHGLQGWVKIHSYTEPRQAIGNYDQWWVGKNEDWRPCEVRTVRCQGKRIIGKLAGSNDCDDAESLRGLEIAIDEQQLEKLDKDQYYWRDLQGLNVSHANGTALGKIARIFDTGANNVIVVKGERERMIPWLIHDVVRSVDLDAGQVVVEWDLDF